MLPCIAGAVGQLIEFVKGRVPVSSPYRPAYKDGTSTVAFVFVPCMDELIAAASGMLEGLVPRYDDQLVRVSQKLPLAFWIVVNPAAVGAIGHI